MRTLAKFLLVLVLCLGFSVHAGPCDGLLRAGKNLVRMGNNFVEFVKDDFAPEVIATRGRRFLTKPEGADAPHGSECFYSAQEPRASLGNVRGFLRDCNAVNALHWLLTDQERTQVLQPFRGTIRYVLREPLGLVTERVFGRRERLVWPIELPVLFAASMVPWIVGFNVVDWWMPIAVQNLRYEEVVRHEPMYLHELRSNYEFHEIRQRLEAGKITEIHAALEVRSLLEFLETYANSQRSRLLVANPTDEQMLELLKIPMFKPLIGLVQNGLRAGPNLEVPKERLGMVRDEVIYQLIQGLDELYLKYQVVKEFADGSEIFRELLKGGSPLSEFAKKLKNDDFTVKLLAMEQSQIITREELQYALGSSLFWERRLADYQLLGAKLKRADGQTVQLSDYRQSILFSLSTKKNSPSVSKAIQK